MRQQDTEEFLTLPPAEGARAVSPTAPPSPLADKAGAVQVRVETLVLPTYMPAMPDKNPMFLEKRVYQGSNGKVYPLPFTDRIAERPTPREWQAIWIENEFVRVLVLPELGGRIHALQDKTNGYDLIYNQPVLKPALVGLAGPWASGGIEFNWPQHHRPATFLPVDHQVEHHEDGAVTVWCSDHDPMCRMKGMHGVCLHPGKAYLELKVRAYNRTPFTQSFLWWANVATRVHEAYQSFFPPDVYYVADHARRSTSEYPLAQGFYYGVNYGERGRRGVPAGEVPANYVPPHCAGSVAAKGCPNYAPNDLSFYANIPVPTSYMCMGSKEDFFGGYDYAAQAGIVHIANHHISPGKKQWTWGNHEFGYAWDRNLTDADANGEFAPYIEIMAGVYTDNQPDFSFLKPGETKTWSQFWYPIQKIGPAQHANLAGAVSLRLASGSPRNGHCAVQLGISVTAAYPQARISLTAKGKELGSFQCDLSPAEPFLEQVAIPSQLKETDLQVSVTDQAGCELLQYQPRVHKIGEVPPPATEPAAPQDITSADELFITGLHLEQYRHATRCPTTYWREALRRDPLDARCNNALGLWHLRRGEFSEAEKHFRNAIARLTRRNANPADGEPLYNLGLCLRYAAEHQSISGPSSLLESAYAAFYKATWNQAWAEASYHALAEIDCTRKNLQMALEHLERALRLNTDNNRARNLKAVVLQRLGRDADAAAVVRETLSQDPLDWWALSLAGKPMTCDLQTRLDIAHDYARAGFYQEAIDLLAGDFSANGQARSGNGTCAALPTQSWGASPLLEYTLGWLQMKLNQPARALKHFKAGSQLSPDYCFPARLEEIAVFEVAMRANPKDARAPYYLGNLFYDRRRHEEAIRLWEQSARLAPDFSVVWRNLGIGYFNILQRPAKARSAYDRAVAAAPEDGRLVYERDQLLKRLGEKPSRRLRELKSRLSLVKQRDDLSLELCALYNQTGQHALALEIIRERKFQPWEGGEGGPLGQHVRSHLALGRQALASGIYAAAKTHFEIALKAPPNLGEAKHLLANQSDIHYWLGCACAALGEKKTARAHWLAAAEFKGDFQEMSVRAFSEMTYYSALSWEQLGQRARAGKLFRELLAYARRLEKTPAQVDYFATSLPAMLLFDDDLNFRQATTALFLQAQAELGLRRKARGLALLKTVLKRDPNHALAADLLAEWQRRS